MARHALLIGVSEFADGRLARLNAPINDVTALHGILQDRARGNFESVELSLNEDFLAVRDRLSRFFHDRAPEDLLLLYYSGHGILGRGNRLFMATAGSNLDRPGDRGISARDVREFIDDSRAGRQIVVLDCCHSGAFAEHAKAAAPAPAVTPETFSAGDAGLYVLTAADALQFAWDGAELRTGNEEAGGFSQFTSWLVEGLEKGEAAPDDEQITMDALYRYLFRRARSAGSAATPQRFVQGGVGDLVISHNPIAGSSQIDPETIAALMAEDWRMRLGAVTELVQLMREGNTTAARAARLVLQRHLENPKQPEFNYRVRDAITDALVQEEKQRSAAPQAEEEKQRAEAAGQAEEERRQVEAARQAAEERRQAAAARQAAEEKQRAEAARQAAEEKRRAETARQAEAERQRAEALRQEAARQQAWEKERAEAARLAEEERQRAEAARLAEEGQVDRAQSGGIPSGDELTRVRGSRARIVSHRRLSRRWLAIAASVLIAIAMAGGGYWLYTEQQRAPAAQKAAEDQQRAAAAQKAAEDQQRAAAAQKAAEDQQRAAAAQKGTPDAPAVLQITKNHRILGNPNAPITIVEYASLTCPHCANFANNILPDMKTKWIDTGKAKLVFRDFPLDEPALRAAMVARCAPPERYYALVDTFFAAQDKWVRSRDYREALARLAKLGGMDQGEFETCIKNTELENKIVEGRLKAAQELNVSSTPAFFVNGSKFSAAPTVQEFDKLFKLLPISR